MINITKTYWCIIHGEFEHECKINDKELATCTHLGCERKVTRVFKLVNHSWKTEGFAGKGF